MISKTAENTYPSFEPKLKNGGSKMTLKKNTYSQKNTYFGQIKIHMTPLKKYIPFFYILFHEILHIFLQIKNTYGMEKYIR